MGCGDSFVAAIAFGYIHNLPLVHTLTVANAVGAATAMGSGAGRNVAALGNVMELLKRSNLNEDDKYLKDVLINGLHGQEVTFLSRKAVNGSNKQLIHVPVQKVVSEVLPKLEFGLLKGNVPV